MDDGFIGYSTNNQWFIGNLERVIYVVDGKFYLMKMFLIMKYGLVENNHYGVTLEDTEGDAPTMRFNYDDMFDKKKLRGRIKINE